MCQTALIHPKVEGVNPRRLSGSAKLFKVLNITEGIKRSPERSILTYSEGWDEGIMEMKLGERSILKISRYEYGITFSPG